MQTNVRFCCDIKLDFGIIGGKTRPLLVAVSLTNN